MVLVKRYYDVDLRELVAKELGVQPDELLSVSTVDDDTDEPIYYIEYEERIRK